MVVATSLNSNTKAVDVPLAVVAFSIFAVALLRYGLLAAVVASGINQLIEAGAADRNEFDDLARAVL